MRIGSQDAACKFGKLILPTDAPYLLIAGYLPFREYASAVDGRNTSQAIEPKPLSRFDGMQQAELTRLCILGPPGLYPVAQVEGALSFPFAVICRYGGVTT